MSKYTCPILSSMSRIIKLITLPKVWLTGYFTVLLKMVSMI